MVRDNILLSLISFFLFRCKFVPYKSILVTAIWIFSGIFACLLINCYITLKEYCPSSLPHQVLESIYSLLYFTFTDHKAIQTRKNKALFSVVIVNQVGEAQPTIGMTFFASLVCTGERTVASFSHVYKNLFERAMDLCVYLDSYYVFDSDLSGLR